MDDVSDIKAMLNVLPSYCAAPSMCRYSGPQIRKCNKATKVLATCLSNGFDLFISTFGIRAD